MPKSQVAVANERRILAAAGIGASFVRAHDRCMTSSRIARLVRITRSAAAALVGAATLVLTVGAAPADAIVGGSSTTGSAYPYYVQLTVNNRLLCGGSLIDPQVVLTAAHCAQPFAAAAPSNRNILIRDQFGTAATSITVHPLYDGHVEDGHDLALIRIAAVTLNPVPVVQVGAPGDPAAYAANRAATVVGHGRPGYNSATTSELRVLNTMLRSDDDMDDIYNPWYWVDNWNESLMIGAGTTTQTVCNGDSGGPLTVLRGVPVQVGVASFEPSGSCDQPGGFAELSGGQLAWVGSQVPSITTKWGPCAPNQSNGKWTAKYQSSASSLRGHDGPNYWDITCSPVWTSQVNPPPAMQ